MMVFEANLVIENLLATLHWTRNLSSAMDNSFMRFEPLHVRESIT